MVAKRGSISSAAESLLLDQSTVSLQMKQLEAAMGRKLLSRSRHGTSLTDTGKLAFDYCDRIFVHAEEMLAAIRDDRPASSPVFRLGVSQTISRDKILSIIRFVKESDPATSVTILSRSSEELETRLERRMLDMVVSDFDLTVRLGRDFKSRLALNVRLFFVAAPEWKKRMRSFPGGLGRVPLLLRARENPVRKEVDYFLHSNGVVPDVRAEVENPDLIRIMASQGEGAAVTDEMSVRAELRQGLLVRLHSSAISARERVWFVSGRSRNSRPAVQRTVDLLMNRFDFGESLSR